MKIVSKAWLLALSFSTLLIGCSSKPDVGDVEAQLKESWGQCKGLKLFDLKKTNGVDHGQTYEMSFSYKLELLEDGAEKACRGSLKIIPLVNAGFADNKGPLDLKKGAVINVNSAVNMIKSEKGWIIQ
jgi:hypothetical protein